MTWFEAALSETASYPFAESLSTFESHIDEAWIEEVLEGYGHPTSMALPAEQVVWLVLGMALMRDRPMLDVVVDLALLGRELRQEPRAPAHRDRTKRRMPLTDSG